jgi:membrane-bound lytic murein transglycosylase D
MFKNNALRALCAATLALSASLSVATGGRSEELQLDLWERVREQLTFQDLENRRIAAERTWYEKNPDYIARVTARSEPYLFYVVEEIERRNMPMEFALLPVMESAYDPFAYSHGRAAGLWQIIPGTGRHLGLTQDWWYDGRRDLRTSTDAALDYLTQLGKTFDGDWLKALAAYNAGPRRIERSEAKNRKKGLSEDFWDLSLPRETLNYVPRLLALTDVVANPGRYGVQLTPVNNSPHFAVVDTGSQIDLAQAAQLAGINLETMYLLNPGYNRWATSPQGPHELLLPIASSADFESKLAGMDQGQRIQWTRYQVRSGDTLSHIAQRFNTESAVIRQVNNMRSNTIVAGKTLMIPTAQSTEVTAPPLASREPMLRKLGYRVRNGDSLARIAGKFNISINEIVGWNDKLQGKKYIHPGQLLTLYVDITGS